jgi:hypothetical protein
MQRRADLLRRWPDRGFVQPVKERAASNAEQDIKRDLPPVSEAPADVSPSPATAPEDKPQHQKHDAVIHHQHVGYGHEAPTLSYQEDEGQGDDWKEDEQPPSPSDQEWRHAFRGWLSLAHDGGLIEVRAAQMEAVPKATMSQAEHDLVSSMFVSSTRHASLSGL